MNSLKIILCGNPNVGKSTLFNRLTGLKQHTGNWTGKTVGSAYGSFEYKGEKYLVEDTPGTYSLFAASQDEEIAGNSIMHGSARWLILVCDACSLKRGLHLLLQVLSLRSNVILCVNFMDEAGKKGVHIDLDALSVRLGIPVVGISAASGENIHVLKELISRNAPENTGTATPFAEELKELSADEQAALINKTADEICRSVVTAPEAKKRSAIDRILTHKTFAWPVMLGFLLIILWLSIVGAKYPSELLSELLLGLGEIIRGGLYAINIQEALISILMDGAYDTVCWVIAAMLPPMVIFFPLFTILEDWGFLPRIAFNTDCAFKKCGTCGKQALTSCMGLGCNVVGVTGCRIIDSPREKLIAIISNSFIPCNGRFAALITISGFLFGESFQFGGLFTALLVTTMMLLGFGGSLLASKLLSVWLFKGKPSSFTLELPPLRRPKFRDIILRSLIDRTLFVLIRALKAAAPAGLLIWVLARISPGGTPLLQHLSSALDGMGKAIGLDGCLLLAFIIGFPANEIVLPVALMCYLSSNTLSQIGGAELCSILALNGWTELTAVCAMVFTVLHWPCAATMAAIKKETGSFGCTALAALLPPAFGIVICLAIKTMAQII